MAARRKPSLPIFVANRLARERPDEIARIVDVAEELTRAHRAGDAAKLRAAQSQLGDAIRTVVEEAEKASGRSLSDAMEQRLAATLRAAATDSSAANLLRSGVLQDEIEPTGFDALAGLQLPPAKKAGKGESKPARAGPSERRREASQARIERLEAELAEAGDEVRAAERALSEAERQEKRARERVAALERQLSRARETV